GVRLIDPPPALLVLVVVEQVAQLPDERPLLVLLRERPGREVLAHLGEPLVQLAPPAVQLLPLLEQLVLPVLFRWSVHGSFPRLVSIQQIPRRRRGSVGPGQEPTMVGRWPGRACRGRHRPVSPAWPRRPA